MNSLNLKYDIESIVYLVTDEDQRARMIVRVDVRKDNNKNYMVMYELSLGSESSWHYDYEFTSDKNVLTKILN